MPDYAGTGMQLLKLRKSNPNVSSVSLTADSGQMLLWKSQTSEKRPLSVSVWSLLQSHQTG